MRCKKSRKVLWESWILAVLRTDKKELITGDELTTVRAPAHCLAHTWFSVAWKIDPIPNSMGEWACYHDFSSMNCVDVARWIRLTPQENHENLSNMCVWVCIDA